MSSATESSSTHRRFSPPPRHPSSAVASPTTLYREAPTVPEDSPATVITDNDNASIEEHAPTEKDLRETYENEEIERFLHLFSAVSIQLDIYGLVS